MKNAVLALVVSLVFCSFDTAMMSPPVGYDYYDAPCQRGVLWCSKEPEDSCFELTNVSWEGFSGNCYQNTECGVSVEATFVFTDVCATWMPGGRDCTEERCCDGEDMFPLEYQSQASIGGVAINGSEDIIFEGYASCSETQPVSGIAGVQVFCDDGSGGYTFNTQFGTPFTCGKCEDQ